MVMPKPTIKENAPPPSLPLHWLLLSLVVTTALLLLAATIDNHLPDPLTRRDDPEKFIAEVAHEFLVNLTSIGPRVAGSYENEVSAVSAVTSSLASLAARASNHNTIDVEVTTAEGAFSLTFFDGMNMFYRDVRSVVARVRARGSPPKAASPPRALLVNCHFDTVPDSPGASDDGAGCAVVLGAVGALAAQRRPLRRPLVALLNGAEENIMQGSHAAARTHRWVQSARAFINLDACGSGGREVVFQWGPHSSLLREYAAAAPRPFGGALAQDLFAAGAIPADTDFRVFRDFANMSGVDLAWARSGYVYHTHLDDIERVSPAVLQRTGDNVLALIKSVIDNTWLDSDPIQEPQPVFFDVMGAITVLVAADRAIAIAIATVIVNAIVIYRSATQAKKELYITRSSWYSCVRSAAFCTIIAFISGLITSGSIGMIVHFLGATLPFYRRPILLLPLFALPSLSIAGLVGRFLWESEGGVKKLLRGDWVVRAFSDAIVTVWSLVMIVGATFGIRSSVIAWWWCSGSSLGALLGGALSPRGANVGALVGALAGASQSLYLSTSVLGALVPLWGRAPPNVAPPNLIMGVVMAGLALANCCWILPIYMVTRNGHKLCWSVLALCLIVSALVGVSPLGAAYSDVTPQRLMMFHTTSTIHNHTDGAKAPVTYSHYWVPELDVNTKSTLEKYASTINSTIQPQWCYDHLTYCGAPYYLPVRSLVPRGVWLTSSARTHPHTVSVSVDVSQSNETTTVISVDVTGPQHIVIVISPLTSSTLSLVETAGHALAPLADKHNNAYFISLHGKKERNAWRVYMYLEHQGPSSSPTVGPYAKLSIAGHWMATPSRYIGDVVDIRQVLPKWTAVTGWPVDLHHFVV